MWIQRYMVVALFSSILADDKVNIQDGGSFSWGWQLTSGPESETVGQYYVKLPQSEQQVKYAAGETGYHGAISVNTSDDHHTHTMNFALGDRAMQLNTDQFQQIHQAIQNTSQETKNLPYIDIHPSMDLYILQNQLPLASNQPLQVQLQSPTNQHQQIFEVPNTSTIQNPYISEHNIQTQQTLQRQFSYENDQTVNGNHFTYNTQRSQQNEREFTTEVKGDSPTNQIFKNNCSDDNIGSGTIPRETYRDMQKSKELFAEIPSYEIQNLETTNRPLTYRGAVHFRVETPRPHARNERFYFTTVVSPIEERKNIRKTQEGINKLVESTQDLISNEDLLKINHAIEKHIIDQNDDIIKPKSRYNHRQHQYRNKILEENKRKNQIVKDRIKEIFSGDIKQAEKVNSPKEVTEATFNHYKFSSPIVVADTFYDTGDQIVNNIVSTMIPYMTDGYEIVSVKGAAERSNITCKDECSPIDIVKVTPRPLGQNYLAPITVGLRLINANGTINSFEDFETSDSELIAKTVANPKPEKTVVEIQESFPIEITHINDVEVHEYLEDGNNNGEATTLYNSFGNGLSSSSKIQENMNLLSKYETKNTYENPDEPDTYVSSKENLESSENIRTEVKVEPEIDDHSQRNEFVTYNNEYSNRNQKIIQPIVIEKEVPVTKFVDRFIEKEVPYAQTVEVRVPVDRPVPVAVPIEKIVEKPVTITRFIDKPYPVEVPRPYPIEVKVPYPVEQKVYIDRPVHVPYPVEKVVERQVVQHVAVPTPVGIPYEVERQVLYPIAIERPFPVAVEVEKRVPFEKIVHKEVRVPYAVERRIPYPVPYETKVAVPYPVERRVPVPVEKIVEKPVTVTKIIEKPVHIEVPVPHPVPVDRFIEIKVPYPVPVDRVVEKKVHVPYPVQKVVERIVQKPVLVTKYVDKPYPVERRVPYAVEKIVERNVPYPVQVPIEIKVPYPVEKIVEKHIHVPVYRYMDKVEESKTNYRYVTPENNEHKNMYDTQNDRIKLNPNIQSTMWGNKNVSILKHNNNTQDKKDFKASQSLKKYLNHLVNSQDSPYQYVPMPLQERNNGLNKNNNYLLELNLGRNERVPKMRNLRIEYGGFKPPMIPSTEVDLDGLPLNRQLN